MNNCALDGWRRLTDLEESIFSKLLSANFVGVEILREQAKSLLVRGVPTEFSLELRVTNSEPAVVETNVPVEASYSDENSDALDCIKTHILLHVEAGYLSLLHFYKDDTSPILRLPRASELTIFTPYHWENE
jgi:hypothetical protein